MGTIRYITTPDGTDVGLYDHEGYLTFHLDQPVTHSWAHDSGVVWEGWTSAWTAEIEKHRDGVRAECECGWHGPELPWTPDVRETDEERDLIMLAWDAHLEDVIAGLAWAECSECHQMFPVSTTDQPALAMRANPFENPAPPLTLCGSDCSDQVRRRQLRRRQFLTAAGEVSGARAGDEVRVE